MSSSKKKQRWSLTFAEKVERAKRLMEPVRPPCWGGRRKREARAKRG